MFLTALIFVWRAGCQKRSLVISANTKKKQFLEVKKLVV